MVEFLPDVLPAFLLAGLGVGFAAPALQIGALTDVTGSDEGLASGLVETAREVGVAAVATVLASQARPGIGSGSEFGVIAAMALLGVLVASLAFPDHARAGAAVERERPRVGTLEPIARTTAAYWEGI